MITNKIINFFLSLTRNMKALIIIISDFCIGLIISIYYFGISSVDIFYGLLLTVVVILFFVFLDVYFNRLKYLSNKILLRVLYLFSTIFILLNIISIFIYQLSDSLFMFLVTFFFFIVVSRLIAQSIIYKRSVRIKNVLIYGAGVSGNKLYKSISVNNPEYNVVAFIDDSATKLNEKIDSISIFLPDQIKFLKKKFNCYAIFIALPTISADKKKSILVSLLEYNLLIKIVPSVKSIVEEKSNFSDIKNIKIEDIIGRDTVKPINSLLKDNIYSKNILITGAGGSIGSELVSQVLQLKPNKVVAVDMSELNLFNLKSKVGDSLDNLDICLGSLNDKVFLEGIIKANNFDIVFHAAAYKHVGLVEENISTAVLNNVYSTFLLADMSIKYNITHFVLVSTDKAVSPSNYMGKSKLITEIIVNKMMHLEKISLSTVRFGNVLNSSGSVLSIFEQQIKNGGPLTVTDKNVTRFFMSIPEAAQLIIQSSAIQSNHNTFILEMGEPYNIYELAKKMIQINGFNVKKDQYSHGIEINITGLKPGEKLHEKLAIESENLKKTTHPQIYSTKEEYAQFNVYEFIKELKDAYNNSEEDKFKKIINTLIDEHQAIN